MKFLLIVAISFAVFSAVLSAVAQGDFSDKNHPGKCKIRDDFIVGPGEHKDPTECMNIFCNANGIASMSGCGAKNIEGCTPGPLANKLDTYPNCCRQQFFCKNADGTTETKIF